MIATLLRIELTKLRRSLALLSVVACPVFVVLTVFLMTLKSSHGWHFSALNWQSMRWGMTAIWAYFMLPLYIALMTSLVAGVEHRHETWRVMFTFPIDRSELFFAKLLVEWGLVLAAHAVLLAAYALVCAAAYLTGLGTDGAWASGLPQIALLGSLASLPVLVIQHALAWRSQHVVLPLGVAIVATMGVVQIGSSRLWPYYPWSYALMALNGASSRHRELALELAVVVAVLLVAICCKWVMRAETR